MEKEEKKDINKDETVKKMPKNKPSTSATSQDDGTYVIVYVIFYQEVGSNGGAHHESS